MGKVCPPVSMALAAVVQLPRPSQCSFAPSGRPEVQRQLFAQLGRNSNPNRGNKMKRRNKWGNKSHFYQHLHWEIQILSPHKIQ